MFNPSFPMRGSSSAEQIGKMSAAGQSIAGLCAHLQVPQYLTRAQ